MRGKYQLTTLGCKVNQYESEQVRELLESIGLTRAGPGDVADIAIVNTCAVTAAACGKSRRAIRRLRGNRDTPVVVIGCAASAEADRLRSMDGVIGVLGHDRNVTAELGRLVVNRLGSAPTHRGKTTHHGEAHGHARRTAGMNDVSIRPVAPTPPHPPTTAETDPRRRATAADVTPGIIPTSGAVVNIAPAPGGGPPTLQNGRAAPGGAQAARDTRRSAGAVTSLRVHTTLTARIEQFDARQRAFLKIQDGCDAHCTYCIIPRLRPTLRSKPIDVAVAEAEQLVRSGHQEIVLTGIFLGAYGRDTAIRRRGRYTGAPLAALVNAIAQVDGLERLRLSSLEPGDLDDALLSVLADREPCVPHLHLPLQSGSPAVLRRMNRQYTLDAYLAMIDRVRRALDTPAITTDIIVGFPGETDAEFDASVEVARHGRVGFCKIHAFPFSPRDGTAAARWGKSFVPAGVVKDRMRRIAEVGRAGSLAFRRGLVGRIERVLVEGTAPAAPRRDRPDAPPDRMAHAPHDAASHAAARRPSAPCDFDHRPTAGHDIRHGRSDRYFEVHFDAGGCDADAVRPGRLVHVRIDRVTPDRTHGTYVPDGAAAGRSTAIAPAISLDPNRPRHRGPLRGVRVSDVDARARG
ncbi:MAG: MiaB/RimO family radical SAM methylthiotransferase [Phycisphaerae bacterium]